MDIEAITFLIYSSSNIDSMEPAAKRSWCTASKWLPKVIEGKTFPKLRRLELYCNCAGEEAIHFIARVLVAGSPLLEYLDIEGNKLPGSKDHNAWTCDALDTLKARGVQVIQEDQDYY